MKKVNLFLITLICMIGFFSSCSNDDNNEQTMPIDKINGEYTGNNLNVRVSGSSPTIFDTHKVTITGDESNLTISIPDYFVPGEKGLEFKNVQMTNGAFCTFNGQNSNADRTIGLTGELVNGKLSLVLEPKYSNGMVGTWNFPQAQLDDNENDISQVISVDLENELGTFIFFGGPQENAYAGVFFNGLLGQGMLRRSSVLTDITFEEDGNLLVTYSSEPDLMGGATDLTKLQRSPRGAMKWYTKGNQIFLVPDMNIMLKNKTKAAEEPMPEENTEEAGLAEIMTVGIPMYFEQNEAKDSLKLFVTKEQILPVFGTINSFVSMLSDTALGDFTLITKMLVGELHTTIVEATRFDLGLHLAKGQFVPPVTEPEE